MEKKQVIMIVYNHFTNDSRVLKEASSLVDNGYKVRLYALWKKGLNKTETISGFEVVRLDVTPIHKRTLGYNGFLWLKNLVYGKSIFNPETTSTSGTVSAAVGKRKKMSFLKFSLSTLNKIFNYIDFYNQVVKSVSADFKEIYSVHSHDMNTLQAGYRIYKKFKCSLVYDTHELFIERDKPYETPNWYKNRQKRFEQKRIKAANKVITVSESIAVELVKRYSIEKPTIVLNAPIRRDKGKTISIKEKLELTDQKVVMYSGGFTRGRGLEYLVESIKFMPDDYRLVFLGFGKEAFVNKLNKIADLNEVTDRFYMYGPVPSGVVPSYLASADICVSPIQNVSLNNYYSFPNKVFEYIQANVPMAVSNFPELKKLVETEKIGTTFNPESPQNIANALVSFLENTEGYNQAKLNIQQCEERYHWGNEEKKLVALYQNIKNG